MSEKKQQFCLGGTSCSDWVRLGFRIEIEARLTATSCCCLHNKALVASFICVNFEFILQQVLNFNIKRQFFLLYICDCMPRVTQTFFFLKKTKQKQRCVAYNVDLIKS